MQAESFFHAAADAKQIIENKNWSLRSQKSKELVSSVARSVVSSKVNLFLTYDTASKSACFGEVIWTCQSTILIDLSKHALA